MAGQTYERGAWSDPTGGLAALVAAGEGRFREIIDALPAAIYTTDALGRITHFNPACVELSGRTPVLGSDIWCVTWKLFHRDGRPMPHDECPMAVALKEGRAIRGVDAIAERPDGTRVWFEPYPTPLFDDEGSVVGGINMLVDITDRKAKEQTLREHARTLEALQRAGSALAAELDTRKLVQAVTDAGTELSGAEFGAFFFNAVGEQGESYVLYTLSGAPPEAFEKFGLPRNTPVFAETFSGRGIVRSDDITRDPRYGRVAPHYGMPEGHLPVRSYLAVPVMARSGQVLGGLFFGHPDVGVFTEQAERLVTGIAAQAAIAIENARLHEAAERRIREQKELIEALGESEERFRMLADNMSQLAWICDELGSATWYNRRWVEYTGLSLEDLKGWNWTKVHHPDHEDRVAESVRRSAATGEPWEDTFPLRGKDGTYRWFLSRATPIRDERGEIVRWFGTNTDITAQRDAEQRAEEASRAKDRFLAVLSHELRTPLTPALMSSAALQKRQDLPSDVRESLATIHRNVELQGRLIDDLLDLSLITSGKLRLVLDRLDVNEVIRRACDTCRADLRERGVHVNGDFDVDAFAVTGDAARMQQVFWNLLSNAAKFTPRGGEVYVCTQNVGQGVRGDERIRISVRDTGIGIASEDLHRVFNPFEQAERTAGGEALMARQFGGMGLGLPICRWLVEQHGGSIRAESDGPGRGSTFIVELPAALHRTESAVLPRSNGSDGLRLPSLRLLVVDDHPDTAAVLSELLRLAGHDVRTAGTGQDALRLVEEHTFDVVVSDLGLPDMTGHELMQQLTQRGLVKGIAISGYGMEEDIERSRVAGFGEHLVKPVTVVRIEQALRRLLNVGHEG
jgi:PAS domain S-box-containing protein